MSLITMAVWDTNENQRWNYTQRTMQSLWDTVDWNKHRLVVVDNGSHEITRNLLTGWNQTLNEFRSGAMDVMCLPANVGTARAINKGWQTRQPGENAIKMDNDVVIYQDGWVDTLDECIQREPRIGIIGLKRTDCIETPWHESHWYRSELLMLPHELFQPWLIVEKVNHVMGTCQMYSSACLDKIGYLYQMGGLYGFDDALASIRAQVAGFLTVMYPSIRIEHIDENADNPYNKWKSIAAARWMDKYNAAKLNYELGHTPVYHGPEDD